MFVVLSKVLPLFVYPPGCVLLVLATAVYLKKHRTPLLILAGLLLWLPSTQWVSLALVHSLEKQHPPLTAPLPQVDAIVVLGGSTLPAHAPRTLPGLNETGERLAYAAWLYEQDVSDRLLLTGGGIEWLNGGLPIVEAQDMAVYLQLLGVPEEALWLETESRNTYENGLFSQKILAEQGIDTIVLVTSAFHMPRSVRIFEKQGFTVIPAPTDFNVTFLPTSGDYQRPLADYLFGLMPTARNLDKTNIALKEYLGLFVYWLRGWA